MFLELITSQLRQRSLKNKFVPQSFLKCESIPLISPCRSSPASSSSHWLSPWGFSYCSKYSSARQTDGQLCLNFRWLLHSSWSSSPLVSACNCQLYDFAQPVRRIKPPNDPQPWWFIPTSPEAQPHPANFRPFYNKNLTYLRWFMSINTPAFPPSILVFCNLQYNLFSCIRHK